jgi:hypothetical protein
VRELLQPVQGGERLHLQIVGAVDAGTADAIVFDLLPHLLIRVEFG